MIPLSRHKIDFLVGLFILCAAIGVVFIALRAAHITDVDTGDGYMVQVRFDNVGTLVERSPVKTSGVRVGRVQSIRYDAEEFVALVDIVIDPGYRFPADSIFSVVSSSLLGGQYVSIDVGGDLEMIESGAVVEGNSALILEELIGKFLFDKAGE